MDVRSMIQVVENGALQRLNLIIHGSQVATMIGVKIEFGSS